jgi:hypothetical protein
MGKNDKGAEGTLGIIDPMEDRPHRAHIIRDVAKMDKLCFWTTEMMERDESEDAVTCHTWQRPG